MITPAVLHPQAQGRDFGAVHIHAGGAGAGDGVDAVLLQGVNHRPLYEIHQGPHAEAAPLHIQQQIGHQLTRPVIGDLPAPVHLHHRNIPGVEHMLGLPRLALSEHRMMA